MSYGSSLKIAVDKVVESVGKQVVSRGTRAVNAIRNAELDVLKGQRSGRVYRKPHSKATYTASAPGEPPARRSGALRLNWHGEVKRRECCRRNQDCCGAGKRTAICWVSGEWYKPDGSTSLQRPNHRKSTSGNPVNLQRAV